MSVIRYPEPVDRGTRRRLVGVTASVATALVDTIAVSVWLVLVVIGTRTAITALLGLGILLAGGLLRSGIFMGVVNGQRSIRRSSRLATAVGVAAGWIAWLLVAEWIGGAAGVVGSGVVLGVFLLVAFTAEREAVRGVDTAGDWYGSLLSPLVLALGASLLLASLWLTTWTASLAVGAESRPVVLTIDAAHVGVLLFGLCAYYAHRRRVQRHLGP